MYFAFNIPEAPEYFTPEMAEKWDNTVLALGDRMRKLEKALLISGLPEADFTAAARQLFDTKSDTTMLDSMTADEIVSFSKIWCGHNPAQPAREEWPNAEVVFDTAFASTRDWESLRHDSTGGSESAQLLGISKWGSAYTQYHSKIGDIPDEKKDAEGQAILDFGHWVEGYDVQLFCKLLGAEVIPETRMFRSKSCPHMTANVDGIVRMPDGRLCVLECKTTSSAKLKEAWADNAVPGHYICQCQHYMQVLNDPRIAGAYICCLAGNSLQDFVIRYIPRDEDYGAEIEATVDRFWSENIEFGLEPEIGQVPERDLEAVSRKYPYTASRDDTVVLPDYLADSFTRYLELGKEIKTLEAEQNAEKAKIRHALGENRSGRVASPNEGMYYSVTLGASTKKSFDKNIVLALAPEVYDAAMTTTEGMGTLRISEKKIATPKASEKKKKVRL